jgi:8-oxo-dGTP pyrophosphatase MutT (NUDIX family)
MTLRSPYNDRCVVDNGGEDSYMLPASWPETIAAEARELIERSGPTAIRSVAVATGRFWNETTGARIAEVCMVIRRPSGTLLTASKTFYPADTYRLMTGGVEQGEKVADALLREVHEETGLHIAIRRLLAIVAYYPEETGVTPDRAPKFYTFAFLVDEMGGTLGALDPHERLAAYREVAPTELRAIADQLDGLPDARDTTLGESWQTWGQFRAVIHRIVADILDGAPSTEG